MATVNVNGGEGALTHSFWTRRDSKRLLRARSCSRSAIAWTRNFLLSTVPIVGISWGAVEEEIEGGRGVERVFGG